jgi:hypothetical protein
MKAIVRKIKKGTEIKDGGHFDSFCSEMKKMIGKEFEFVPKSGTTKWFTNVDPDGGYNFYVDWLGFLK